MFPPTAHPDAAPAASDADRLDAGEAVGAFTQLRLAELAAPGPEPPRDIQSAGRSASDLVLNAVVLWTTRHIDAAVAQLRVEGHEISDEDVARLSPLEHKNLNCLGRYSFTASQPVEGLRPLRAPDAVDLDDDDDDDGQEA
ncbi:Tn3 family transposase [Streptomyces rishiriensis]|uniref:Tn3 family transposase n=1 Tax=Streptomyces rishiriensis TaxID=68264 RepID=UPI0033CE228D